MAAAAALIMAPGAAAQPDDPLDEDWVAMAISPGVAGGYGVAGTAQDAIAIAIAHCRNQAPAGPCITAEVIRFGCVAYATESPVGSWATASGPDVNAASAAALAKLPPGSSVQFTRCWNPNG